MPSGGPKKYLAFDIGAESGRAVLARLTGETIAIEEVHRFPNHPLQESGSLHWDVKRLWDDIRKALSKVDCELQGVGVDTWGVDYALLDEAGELVENPYHYRDSRTRGIPEEVFEKVSKREIYSITGIQFMPINTLYQLFAEKKQTPEVLSRAKRLVMMPDLFHYWMTGNAVCEFTNASTTQMVNATTRRWDSGLLERVGVPSSWPASIVEPGTVVGKLLPNVGAAKIADTPVIAPATHDTGSAVAAIAAREGTAFISSGTWSLVGIEVDAPVASPDALQMNFSNEGGVNGTTRLLKNVMGLWMFRCCRECWSQSGNERGYEQLVEQAAAEPAFAHLVDPDDDSFLAPENMCTAIDEFCARTHQPKPATPAGYTRCILESLALKYRKVIEELEHVSGEGIEQIRIIGGGSKNRLLNQFTADATGRRVLAGPVEATALGNAAVQILATGEAGSLREARSMIERSFPVETFKPRDPDRWTKAAERFQHYRDTVYA
ncbi:MAG TPA: rhamnulokinase [Terriglobales bacterium]|nr:rhamnulokinase [Terriglobales bacterium]